MLRKTVTDSFAVGASETSVVQMNELYTLSGLILSASYVTGSLVSFLGSMDGDSYLPIFNSNSAEVTLTVTGAARFYSVNPSDFSGWNFIKARLGTSGSAKLQAVQPEPVTFVLKADH